MVQRFQFPNTLVIMVGFILFASLLAYTIPQGEYTRETDAATGRTIVVPDLSTLCPLNRSLFFRSC